jgi:hypothetical protein
MCHTMSIVVSHFVYLDLVLYLVFKAFVYVGKKHSSSSFLIQASKIHMQIFF